MELEKEEGRVLKMGLYNGKSFEYFEEMCDRAWCLREFGTGWDIELGNYLLF